MKGHQGPDNHKKSKKSQQIFLNINNQTIADEFIIDN